MTLNCSSNDDNRLDESKIVEMVVRYLDSEMDRSELTDFENLLRNDIQARSIFVRIAANESRLSELLSSEQSVATSCCDINGCNVKDETSADLESLNPLPPQLPPQTSSPLNASGEPISDIPVSKGFSTFSNWAMFLGVCAVILVVAGAYQLGRQANVALGPRQIEQPELATKPVENDLNQSSIAYLTSSNGCSWGETGTLFVSGDKGVQKGDELTLLEGNAEFQLASGVALSVEGPSGIILTSPTSLVLQFGKVTAQVPWAVKDFKILAGSCRFEATDAEFGISVIGGRDDAHAFTGKIVASNVMTADDRDSNTERKQSGATSGTNVAFTKAVIKPGRALTLVNQQDGVVKMMNWSRARPWMFATRLIMSGDLPVSESYVNAIRESKPAAYWRFETAKTSVIASEVPTGCDLNIVGDVRISGTTENRVAEFAPGCDCYLASREPLDWIKQSDYSVELWVKPNHIHSSAVVSMCGSDPVTGLEAHAYMLELQNSGRQPVRGKFSQEHPFSVRYLHRSPPNRSSMKGTSCFSKDFYSVRRWQHMTTVKRGDEMQLFVDGKLSASTKDDTQLIQGLYLLLGRQFKIDNVFQFIGQMDELAIYNRALSEEEILNHFSKIDWSKSQQKVDKEKLGI
jgi:hypothetical protein